MLTGALESRDVKFRSAALTARNFLSTTSPRINSRNGGHTEQRCGRQPTSFSRSETQSSRCHSQNYPVYLAQSALDLSEAPAVSNFFSRSSPQNVHELIQMTTASLSPALLPRNPSTPSPPAHISPPLCRNSSVSPVRPSQSISSRSNLVPRPPLA